MQRGLLLDFSQRKGEDLKFCYFLCKSCGTILFDEYDLLSVLIADEALEEFYFVFEPSVDE